MVVISAAIISKGGKILFARQPLQIAKNRIESLLTAFPKLLNTSDKEIQHTFIETKDVRYLFQPLEQLYLVLITETSSNLIADLRTLKLFSEVVIEFAGNTEEAIVSKACDLIHAVDELLTPGGYEDQVTIGQIRTFMEMDSHEEKLAKMILESKMNAARSEATAKAEAFDRQKQEQKKLKDAMGSLYSKSQFESSSYSSSSYPATVAANSTSTTSVSASTAKSSSSSSFSSSSFSSSSSSAASKPKGMQLSKAKKQDDFLSLLQKEENLPTRTPEAKEVLQAATKAQPQNGCQVVVEEKLFVELERDCSLKKMEIRGEMKLVIFDPDDSKVMVKTNGLSESEGFKPRLHPKINKQLFSSNGKICLQDTSKSFPIGSENAAIVLKWTKKCTEDDIPVILNFWPNIEDGRSVVNVDFTLQNEALSFPSLSVLIACPFAPDVNSVDGDIVYDSSKKVLTWNISNVSSSHSSGSLEFSIPEIADDDFFPIHLNFFSTITATDQNNSNTSPFSKFAVDFVSSATDEQQRKPFTCDYILGVDKYCIE